MSVTTLPEIRDLLSWLGRPPRSPRQTHGVNESDCEMVLLGDGRTLAAKVDCVADEILAGLYRDPFTAGWMAAMGALSDLAAVGAAPLGLLFSAQWDPSWDASRKSRAAAGVSEALRHAHTFLLGGDTGTAGSTVLSGVALGLCSSKPVSRVGMRPGDVLCLTGATGNGPAMVFRWLREEPADMFPETWYRPIARMEAGQDLVGIATAAMDTSDGLFTTLETLKTLNDVSFDLAWSPELLSSLARDYCSARGIPHSLLWFAEHGDFQLVVSVPEACLAVAQELVGDLAVLGRVTGNPFTRILLPDGTVRILDWAEVRGRLKRDSGGARKALPELADWARKEGLP